MSQESLSPEQIEAAQEFADSAIRSLTTAKGYHVPTVIAATARMAGTFMFRSFGFELEDAQPGQPVLSEQANDAGQRLMQITASVLSHLGVALDHGSNDAATAGSENESIDFLTTQKQLETIYIQIKDRHGLSLPEAAEAAAVASAILIHQGADTVDPNVGFGIAVYGFIEGTKTVPAAI